MNTQISGTEYRVQKKNHTDYLIFDRGPRELNGEKKKKCFNTLCSCYWILVCHKNK